MIDLAAHPLMFQVNCVHGLMLKCSVCLAAQSCPTLCDPVDCSPSGLSVHGDPPGKNTEVGCHALLRGIFPTQGSNPGPLHCKQTLYLLPLVISCRYYEKGISQVKMLMP